MSADEAEWRIYMCPVHTPLGVHTHIQRRRS